MARVSLNRIAFRTAAAATSGYHQYARRKASELQEVAEEVFKSQQVKHNEWRTSETTPPEYLESWNIYRDGENWYLENTDPASMWVEFGAHAGGETKVLEYRPLTRAIDIVASRTTEGG